MARARHGACLRRSTRWPCLRLRVALLVLLLACALAQTLSALTGRVVDGANLLSRDQRAALEAKLKAHEDKTSDQVVVATVPRLEGYAVEDYANRLFRQWKLGQAERTTASCSSSRPNERKVRIEVGYGLEGALTDALSKVIIATAIAPQFQKGDFAGGIECGRRRDPVHPHRRRGGMAAAGRGPRGRRSAERSDPAFIVVVDRAVHPDRCAP